MSKPAHAPEDVLGLFAHRYGGRHKRLEVTWDFPNGRATITARLTAGYRRKFPKSFYGYPVRIIRSG